MSDLEFEHKGQAYRAGKLDAKKQFHVSRRLAPFLADVMRGLDPKDMPAMAEEAQATGQEDQPNAKEPKDKESADLAWLDSLANTLADMPDEPLDYILNACLAVTARKQVRGGWAKVQGPGGLMFEDIDMAGMLTITFNVLKHNLSGFFDAVPQGLFGVGRT